MKERIGRLLKMHANKREEIKEVYAGDIAAAVGLQERHHRRHHLRPAERRWCWSRSTSRRPSSRLAVEPKTKADQEKLGQGLGKLMQEDPTFKVETDRDTGQTKISGMGELHLEIIVDRLKREFSVEANVGKPQVAYKETIRRPAKGEGKLHQADGRPRPVRPRQDRASSRRPARGSSSRTTSRAAPSRKEFIKPIEEGIREALERGILAGYSDGRRARSSCTTAATTTSTPRRWPSRSPARMAFQDAAKKASPVLLEPIMKVEVVTPDDYTGAVTGDLTSRRGHIEGTDLAWRHADHHRHGAAVATCSDTRPTCARAPRGAPPTRCTSSSTPRPRAT